ncbi:MAG: prephenate dehydrogenase/arogenate dehydrogenase family protein [Dehalococcoidia bacterium]
MSDQETTGKIAIIGLGLIGTSLGLALKAGGLTETRIIGYDANGGTARTAQKRGAVDETESSAAKAVANASLVIVAVPILNVREVFQEIAHHLVEGATVTDTASTKADVMRWAAETLPETVNFVGGHPMAGKETPGPDQAEAGLFQGRPYCVCPSLSASPEAIKSVTGMAAVIGAEVMYMDPEEHDQYAAAVSHMPLMVSTALFTLTRSSGSWNDLGAVAGPAFTDMTRLASGDPALAMGIWRTNREALIHWLERMAGELGRFRELLKDAQDEVLLKVFAEAQFQREDFLQEPPARRPEPSGVQVDKGKALMDMLIGARLADNLRRGLPPEDDRKASRPAKSTEKDPRISMAERVAEGVKRDLEKMEKKKSGNTIDSEGPGSPQSPE